MPAAIEYLVVSFPAATSWQKKFLNSISDILDPSSEGCKIMCKIPSVSPAFDFFSIKVLAYSYNSAPAGELWGIMRNSLVSSLSST